MYYLGINKTTRLAEMIVYSTNPPIDDAVYTYRFEENPQSFMFRKFINGQWSSEKFEPVPVEPPLSPMDMLGMVTTQNSLELSELKQQVEAIGQGVVEIMLNQQLGGM